MREFFYAVTDCTKPVIAAVNGPALGAGFVLMLACDIMLACEEAYFSMPEINVGLAGGARFLMEQVGRSKTRSIYFTGRRVPAAELYRLGVIEACPPRDKLMEAALDIAREIASKSPLAIAKIKRTLNAIEEMPVRDAYRFEQIGHGRAVAHRGRPRGAARLRREAQAGVQGALIGREPRGKSRHVVTAVTARRWRVRQIARYVSKPLCRRPIMPIMLFFIYPAAILQACFLPPMPAPAQPRPASEDAKPVD